MRSTDERNDMKNGAHEKVYVSRFSVYRLVEHWAVAAAFIVLAMTGLSQRFSEFEISQWFVMTFGGIDRVRLVHRLAGIMFGTLMVQHIFVACWGVLVLKWEQSIIIYRRDFADAVENLKYYFGLTNHPAACGRYDYKQKFEYWGIFAGGLVMIATGLILWFPVSAAQLLPGAIIPAAKALHTSVAMMIFLIIAIWHIYNSIFSPEVFPFDTVIFTGKIDKARMRREHPLEYERLFGREEQPVDDVPAAKPGQKKRSRKRLTPGVQ